MKTVSILRRVLLFLSLVAAFGGARAQWASIPDSNFGTWLNANGYTTCLAWPTACIP